MAMLNNQMVLCYHDIPHNIAIFIGKSTCTNYSEDSRGNEAGCRN